MASERGIFSISGPFQLNAIDWRNTFHRRSVAASLVQGVYILEHDRQHRRYGPYALAPPWWESFHFQLNHVLIDDADASIYGAVYEYRFPPHPYINPPPPRYIIAFRGTIIKPETRMQDMKLNLKLICQNLKECPRFHYALQVVKNLMGIAGPPSVWLAGHSLGSAIALLLGKNMAKWGYPLETYLFNPPFISVPIEMMNNETLKHGIRIASSLVTAGLALVRNTLRKHEDLDFTSLSTWTPYMFVNGADPICAEYIGYFEHREKMEEIGAGGIEMLATKHSIGNLFSGRDSEPLHLLPSAYLTVNLSHSEDFKQAHGVHQWWVHHFQYQSKLHRFKFY